MGQFKKKLDPAITRLSIDEIRKKGHEGVRVLDTKRIGEMVYEAVETVIRERNVTLLDEQRDLLAEQVREDFLALVEAEKKAIERERQLAKMKANLDQESEKLVQLTQQIAAGEGASPDVLIQRLKKITERQKSLFDKYHEVDKQKRDAESRVLDHKQQMLKLLEEIETMKARGQMAPSRYIEEVAALKDVRDDLRRRLQLQHQMLRRAAVSEYHRKQQLPEPALPPKGHGVAILVGDRETPSTGIKVRYEPGSNEPIIEYPEAG